jgi:hypothetical protein
MRRLFATVFASRRWKLALLLGAIAGALAATAYGAYAAARGSDTIKACAKAVTGQLRLDNGSGCGPGEQALQWNQTGPPGPPGPPGSTDSTVRHISQFMFDGTTVSTPIVSANGERGKLSIFCGSDPDGSRRGIGHITFTTDNTSSTLDALTFVSPSIPTSTWTQVHGQATFPWADTQGDNVSFEVMIESQMSAPPTLTDIRGFIQHFDFGCCDFYVYVDTSEVQSPMTFTP